MIIHLIRHAQTAGNQTHSYVGATDQPILEEFAVRLEPDWPPQAERLYISPMCRCRQTAKLVYPDLVPQVVEDLRECNFGAFEGKTHEDLKELAEYQHWITAGDKAVPPHGESTAIFRARCCAAFRGIVAACIADRLHEVAVLSHGGTIMSILAQFGEPGRSYYDWKVKNIGGFSVELSPAQWESEPVLHILRTVGEYV